MARYDVMVAQRVYSADSAFTQRVLARGGGQPLRLDSLHKRSSFEAFDSLTAWMTIRLRAADLSELERARLGLLSVVLRSNANVARDLLQPSSSMRTPDATIARNIQFIADTLYPAPKIVLWSRNAYVHRGSPFAKLSGQMPSVAGIVRSQPSIAGVYSIGVYAASGTRRRAGGRVDPPSANMM